MIITRTPFRISFFGGGTDYPVWFEKYGGATLSTSIDKYCYITCRNLPPFFEHTIRFVWSKIELTNDVEGIEHPTAREALKYLGFKNGIEIHHNGDLPARAGLGSSSSFVVGLLNGLYALKGLDISKSQLAIDAVHIEQGILKNNVGCQDHFAAAFGGFNKITYAKDKIEVQPITFAPGRKRELEGRLMLFFTGLARNASDIAEEQIKNTPQKESELNAMLNMVNEAVQILENPQRELVEFGSLLHRTWQLKKTLSSAISTPHIDRIYDRAIKAGARGGKLLGAGGGGFILFYVEPEAQLRVREALKDLLHVPFSFEDSGTQIIYNINGTQYA